MRLREILSDQDPLAEPLLDLLERHFPPNQRETREEARRQLRHQRGLRSWALLEGEELIGLARGAVDIDSRCGWLVHLALDPKWRGGGRGAEAFHHLVRLWKEDTKGGLRGVFLEVERLVDAKSDAGRAARLKRLAFFSELGAQTLSAAYIQPPSAPGNPSVTLNLLWVGEVVEDKAEAIRNFYRIAFELPASHEWVLATARAISDRPA